MFIEYERDDTFTWHHAESKDLNIFKEIWIIQF